MSKTQRIPAKGTKLPFDRDKMSMLNRESVMENAFKAMDAVQTQDLELQVASVATLFAAYVTRLNLSAEGMYQMGRRFMVRQDHHRQANDQSDTLTDFIGGKSEGRF
jgi:hypothetical protein